MFALDAAKFFLTIFDENTGELVSNLKLQKLLYYAQGFHLAMYNTPLFEDKIEAWAHGPVVPVVYRNCDQYGKGNLPFEAVQAGNVEVFSDDQLDLLKQVQKIYGQYSAWRLEELTHQEPPWKNTANGHEISHARLAQYFKTQIAADNDE